MQTPVASSSRNQFPLPYYLLSHNMEAFRQGVQSDDVFWGVGSAEDLLASNLDFSCRRMGALSVYHNSPAMSSNSSIASYSPHTPSPALLPDTHLPLVMVSVVLVIRSAVLMPKIFLEQRRLHAYAPEPSKHKSIPNTLSRGRLLFAWSVRYSRADIPAPVLQLRTCPCS